MIPVEELKRINDAVNDFIRIYADARQRDYIKNPIAYALYQTWKKWSEEDEQ